MKYLKYLRYLLVHKWFVFVECAKLGIWWRGIVHDMSKFLPSEFFPYANKFFGIRTPEAMEAFKLAWLRHQKLNRHHWQWWELWSDNGSVEMLEITDEYRREMLADWRGAGRAQGKGDDVREWYLKNKNNIRFNSHTRAWIEAQIGI